MLLHKSVMEETYRFEELSASLLQLRRDHEECVALQGGMRPVRYRIIVLRAPDCRCRDHRDDHRNRRRRGDQGADRRGCGHGDEPVADRARHDRCVGALYVPLARSRHVYDLGERRRLRIVSIAGISVFADQSQTMPIALQKSLKQIARVTSRSSLSPVRPGTGTDVYSVNPGLTNAAATIGGGGGLNNAYSAIAAMPGAYVPPNQVGVNQTVYIRGGYYDQIGYEYDGVPINRSFDNYPGNSETTLGQQELQIYTGGGEADANATGLGGLHQPGHQDRHLSRDTPSAGVSAGNADLLPRCLGRGRRLDPRSYLFVLRRHQRDESGFSLLRSVQRREPDRQRFRTGTGRRTSRRTCRFIRPSIRTAATTSPSRIPVVKTGRHNDPGCFGSYPSNYGQPSSFNSRDIVTNFHIGIPHRHDAGRDDIQMLYMSSANFTQDYSSLDDAGPLGHGHQQQRFADSPPDFYGGDINQWPDFYTFPGTTRWLASASTPQIAYIIPARRPGAARTSTDVPNACPLNAHGNQIVSLVPSNYRDGRWDTASITKLQYQKNLGSTAYVRLFGYTFYSNTNRATANGWGNNDTLGVTNYQYEVDSHTGGSELQFADQISGAHLTRGMVSYITSNTFRYLNHNYFNGGPAGQQLYRRHRSASPPARARVITWATGAVQQRHLARSRSSRPYGDFNGQRPVHRRRAFRELAGLRGGRLDAANLPRKQRRHQRRLAEGDQRLARRSVAPQRPMERQPAVRFENDAYGLGRYEQSRDELLVRGGAARVLRQSGDAAADLRAAAAADSFRSSRRSSRSTARSTGRPERRSRRSTPTVPTAFCSPTTIRRPMPSPTSCRASRRRTR